MQTKPITKASEDFKTIRSLYKSSFPESERSPMWFLLRRAKRDFVDFLAYYDEDKLVGFTYLIHNKKLTYVLYLAVCENSRSKGYGSQILSHIRETFPNNRIMLFIESEDEKTPNNNQRKKRKEFYIKNGYVAANFMMEARGNIFEVLTQGGKSTADELMELTKKFVGSFIFIFVKSYMQILEGQNMKEKKKPVITFNTIFNLVALIIAPLLLISFIIIQLVNGTPFLDIFTNPTNAFVWVGGLFPLFVYFITGDKKSKKNDQ